MSDAVDFARPAIASVTFMLDCSSDEEMRLNKGHTLRLWFKVDRGAKLFKVLAYDFCDLGSCTDGIMAQIYEGFNDRNETVKMGEWDVKVMANQFETDEYSLNALNTVMRSINFCEEGVNILNAGDDIGRNMTFYFPKPIPTTSVCVGLVPTPPDNTAEQIAQATIVCSTRTTDIVFLDGRIWYVNIKCV